MKGKELLMLGFLLLGCPAKEKENREYFVPSNATKAEEVTYNQSQSNLPVDNVQEAIDLLGEKTKSNEGQLRSLQSRVEGSEATLENYQTAINRLEDSLASLEGKVAEIEEGIVSKGESSYFSLLYSLNGSLPRNPSFYRSLVGAFGYKDKNGNIREVFIQFYFSLREGDYAYLSFSLADPRVGIRELINYPSSPICGIYSYVGGRFTSCEEGEYTSHKIETIESQITLTSLDSSRVKGEFEAVLFSPGEDEEVNTSDDLKFEITQGSFDAQAYFSSPALVLIEE